MKKKITTEEFDKKFDNNEDVSAYIDYSKSRRPNREAKRVNIDFPAWVVSKLDQEAARIGITRQAVVKTWIAERIDEEEKARA